MDAQEVTFNQDPEANATDIDKYTAKGAHNCWCQCCCCNLLYWYISPITCKFCYTLKCFIFHPINFAVALFLIIWDITMLSLGIAFIPLCCMGVPLLWISVEFIMFYSQIDLAIHYYLIEDGSKMDKSREHLLKLSIKPPPCCCTYGNCMDNLYERMKHLFTKIEVYKYVLYHIFVKPVLAFITYNVIFVVIVNVAGVCVPIWYLWDDRIFVKNKMYLGWNSNCSVDDNNNAIDCDKDYIFIINTFNRALGVGIISLLILPLVLRFNNYMAYLNKIIAYRFYTYYYTSDIMKINDKKPILVMIDDNDI